MKLKGIMIVVDDINKSRQFYKDTLGLRVTADFGENITLTGGLSLQSKSFWCESIIHKPLKSIVYGGNDAEIYFEEEDLDKFIDKLRTFDNIDYVHKVYEQLWGQRSVRFYDLDGHIVEVAESMTTLCQRLLDSGLTVEQIAEKTYMSVNIVKSYLK